MSDRELDTKMAELMGLKKVGYYRLKNQFIVEWELCDKGDLDPFGNKARLYYYPDPGFLTIVPEYSRDIAAAMQVEERIEELGLVEKYCNHLASIVWSYQAHPAPLPLKWYSIHASPEDRCRAALMAAEAEK